MFNLVAYALAMSSYIISFDLPAFPSFEYVIVVSTGRFWAATNDFNIAIVEFFGGSASGVLVVVILTVSVRDGAEENKLLKNPPDDDD